MFRATSFEDVGVSHKGKVRHDYPKGSCCNLITLVGLQNSQGELGWKVFRPRNSSANEKNGITQGIKDLKEFKDNRIQPK
jgi:hypothetical protein